MAAIKNVLREPNNIDIEGKSDLSLSSNQTLRFTLCCGGKPEKRDRMPGMILQLLDKVAEQIRTATNADLRETAMAQFTAVCLDSVPPLNPTVEAAKRKVALANPTLTRPERFRRLAKQSGR